MGSPLLLFRPIGYVASEGEVVVEVTVDICLIFMLSFATKDVTSVLIHGFGILSGQLRTHLTNLFQHRLYLI